MRKKLFRDLELVLLLAMISGLMLQSGQAVDSTVRSYQTLHISQEAVGAAEAYSGLFSYAEQSNAPEMAPDTRLITFKDSTTAFISSQLNDRRVHHVVFAPVKLQLADARMTVVEENPLGIEVFLDSTSGQLIKISIFPINEERYEVPYISPVDAERQLARSGQEHLGLPETPPATSLLETIETAMQNGKYFCSFYNASLVTAKYLLWRQWDGEVIPVWVIDCYGGFSVGKASSDHMRNVYNAQTLEGLMSSNMPLPPLKRGND